VHEKEFLTEDNKENEGSLKGSGADSGIQKETSLPSFPSV
jgi:hypothetical protein